MSGRRALTGGIVISCVRGITNARPVRRPVLRMRKIPGRVSKGTLWHATVYSR